MILLSSKFKLSKHSHKNDPPYIACSTLAVVKLGRVIVEKKTQHSLHPIAWFFFFFFFII